MKLLIKHIIILFLVFFSSSDVYGTELIKLIDSTYQSLDSAEYISTIKTIVYKDLENRCNISTEFVLEMYDEIYQKYDSDMRMHLLDSIKNKERIFSEKWITEQYDNFISNISNKRKIWFLLNIKIERDTISNTNKYLIKPDTSKMCFNIYIFGKYSFPDSSIDFENGEFQGYGPFGTFSQIIAKKGSVAFKRIMKKQPKYLLYCYQLEQMNTIMYVLDDKIYVYRVVEMEEYELNEYLKKFQLW